MRNRVPLLSLILIGACFAVPAYVFTCVIFQTTDPPWWQSLPVISAIGTILTAMCVWKLMATETEEVSMGVLSGAIIGILSHPVVAFLVGLANVWEETIDQTGPESLMMIGYFVLLWSYVAVFGLGWITLVTGAVVGGILGGVHLKYAEIAFNRRITSNIKSSTPALRKPELPELPRPWSSLKANLFTLGFVTIVSALTLFAFSTLSPSEIDDRVEVIHEQDAEL